MAEIFLARVEALPGFQKIVVIKRILPQLASKRDFIEMFLDEARIAATLQHPNLVQVYDVGLVDGNYFMSMEYLHGEDIRGVMKTLVTTGRSLPVEHALNVMIGVCAGLHYAHDKVGFDGRPLNIIHRDVTPQNVIVTFEGGVKLLDFGIAKASNRSGETRFGTLKGKVPYMSPEQCRGEVLDRRTDVFSIGIMLYELTLGRRLFRAKSEFEVMKMIVDGEIAAPSSYNPDYDPTLEQIVMRALAKDRDLRYSSAAELQADLESYVQSTRIYLSSNALKQFMEQLFGQKVEAWREAQAQGRSLGEHLETMTLERAELSAGETAGETADIEMIEDFEVDYTGQLAGATQVTPPMGVPSQAPSPRTTSGSVPTVKVGGSPATVRVAPLSVSGNLAVQEDISSVSHLLPRRTGARWLVVGAAVVLAGGVAVWRWPRATIPAPVPMASPVPVAPLAPVTTTAPLPAPIAPVPIGIVKLTGISGSTIYLDGKKREETVPATLDGVEANRDHVLLIQHMGYQDLVQNFTLRPNQVLTVEAKLVAVRGVKVRDPGGRSLPRGPNLSEPMAMTRPAPPREPPVISGNGALLIDTNPWCNVSIDGASRGVTPLKQTLSAGTHSVSLSNPEYKINKTISVTILPNETLRKKLDFQ